MAANSEVDFEELLVAVSFVQDALVKLLVEKGLITEQELLTTIGELHNEE